MGRGVTRDNDDVEKQRKRLSKPRRKIRPGSIMTAAATRQEERPEQIQRMASSSVDISTMYILNKHEVLYKVELQAKPVIYYVRSF